MPVLRNLTAAILCLLCTFCSKTVSHAQFVYWANTGAATIGRANADGTGANQSFITDAGSPYYVAVDENFIYWSNLGGGTIGRANLDGSSPDLNFMTGLVQPTGLTVNDTHIFWTSQVSTAVGRANLDGTSPNAAFISTSESSYGVAVDDTHVFWGNCGTSIGRANLDGTSADNTFITGASCPSGLTVNATHIFWANASSTTIGRAEIDGTDVNQSFVTGGSGPGGTAANATHLFWTSQNNFTIGRSNIDGTSANHSFITGANFPIGVQVNPEETVLPVELIAFEANVRESVIVLAWATASETDNAGFEVEQMDPGGTFHTIGFVDGHGTTSLPREYAFNVDVSPGRHAFRLKQVDFDGTYEYSAIVEATVELPGTHVLGAVYPNPFHQQAIVELTVARRQQVRIDLFNALGRHVRVIHEGPIGANVRRSFSIDGDDLPAGSYFVSATGESFRESRSALFLR